MQTVFADALRDPQVGLAGVLEKLGQVLIDRGTLVEQQLPNIAWWIETTCFRYVREKSTVLLAFRGFDLRSLIEMTFLRSVISL